MHTDYQAFLERKIKIAEPLGFEFDRSTLPDWLKPHQNDLIAWAIRGGRRAIFASFGLGKTVMQIEIAHAVVNKTGKPFLIGTPLDVRSEFEEDAAKLNKQIRYVRDMQEVHAAVADGVFILMSNYERIREDKFDPSYFGGVSFDEGAVIRNLDSKTADYIINKFSVIKYRYVATAVPSPNDYTELLNYAHFLGIMDRSQALTRFFQRNSTKAGDLSLYPHKKREFWLWVHSWAVFLTKPSLLGYSDEGYDLPELKVNYHRVQVSNRALTVDRDGSIMLYRDASLSMPDASKEKRESITARIDKMMEIINADPESHRIIWHHLEPERIAIEKALPGVKTVYGKQDRTIRKEYLKGFTNGKYKYLATKPEIAGSGCNFQRFCHKAIFLGLNDKFHDIIQAIHRILRFLQQYQVEIDFIYTDAEEGVLRRFQKKWNEYKEQMLEMEDIIKEYGLSNVNIKSDMSRSIGVERQSVYGSNYQCIYNDSIVEVAGMEDNSVDLIVTSIPFSDQYEYCESYNDMGHNDGDNEFFKQMDFLTGQLLRVTKPGRIACIHVKDRIRYSYQTGQGFTSLNFFHSDVIQHFKKHGWYGMGMHTITTDVVAENSQTYRLGWTENNKDGTKMGCGLPEYLLVFRKPPTNTTKAYADVRVIKNKESMAYCPLCSAANAYIQYEKDEETYVCPSCQQQIDPEQLLIIDGYSRGRWQLDAHAFWKSSGERLLDPVELRQLDLSRLGALWNTFDSNEIYSYERHVKLCENLDSIKHLPSSFMAVPPHSNSDVVWDDINRMRTLNSDQARRKLEKHVCPLQFDIVDRCITRYSNEGETVLDPFAGIMTVPFRALKKKRRGIGIELNKQYWADGLKYCRYAEMQFDIPTLFDAVKE